MGCLSWAWNVQRGIYIFLMEDHCLIHNYFFSLLGERVPPTPTNIHICTDVMYTHIHTCACLQVHLGFSSLHSFITLDFMPSKALRLIPYYLLNPIVGRWSLIHLPFLTHVLDSSYKDSNSFYFLSNTVTIFQIDRYNNIYLERQSYFWWSGK